MKIEIELGEGIYQALGEMWQGMDVAVAISEMLRALVLAFAAQPEEFMRAYGGGSDATLEDRRKIEEKWIPKVIKKAKIKDNEANHL